MLTVICVNFFMLYFTLTAKTALIDIDIIYRDPTTLLISFFIFTYIKRYADIIFLLLTKN